MDRSENRYSRFVATLKVLLPLAALVLLSTLFLLARVPESGLTGRFSGQLAADGRMHASTFTTMTADGPLTVTAQSATPRAADYAVVDLEGLAAELDVVSERGITLTAQTGRLMRPDREATFEGAVQITTTDGFVLQTEQLRTAFDASWAESPGAIAISGPDFTLKAGTMAMVEGENGRPAARVLFNEGVRLVYVPQPASEQSDPVP
ncbi:MAG: hypothetical protein AAGB05_15075 [Pseudomonadota bacterium]